MVDAFEAVMTSGRHHRLRYLAAAVATIVVGLWVHRSGEVAGLALSAAARDILGDALWAAMMVWWIGVLRPLWPTTTRAAAAYAIAATVEVSQLWHTPTLDAWRATTLGHLVLGSGFDSRDLMSYALGVAVAALLDSAARRVER